MQWFSSREISGVSGLPKMGRKLANASGWTFSKRAGNKTFEYRIYCLPELVRKEVLRIYYNTLLQQPPVKAPVVTKTMASLSQLLDMIRQCSAALEQKTSELPQKQGDIADIRISKQSKHGQLCAKFYKKH